MSTVPTVFLIDQGNRPLNIFDFGSLNTRGIVIVAALVFGGTVLFTQCTSAALTAIVATLTGKSSGRMKWDTSYQMAHFFFSGFFSTMIFQRWSRSSKVRSHAIVFSRALVVEEVEGKVWYCFKVVDCESQHLGGVNITVRILRDHELLDVTDVQVKGHTGLVIPAHVSFSVDRPSVCDVCGKDMLTKARLALHSASESHMQRSRPTLSNDWEVLVTVSGMDSFSNKAVVAYHRYNATDLVSRKFANKELMRGKGGLVQIDFDKFDDLDEK